MTIQEKFESLSLSPGSKEWDENIDPEFIRKYEQYIDLKNINTDGSYDTELSQMDAELVEFFDELHQIDELEEKINEDQQDDKTETIIVDNNSETETQESENLDIENEKLEETEKELIQEEKQQKNKEEEQRKKEPEKTDEIFVPSAELLAFLETANEVRASHLRKYKVPRKVWKENEESFSIGNFKLVKEDPADLLLNNWKVMRQ